MSQKTGKSGGRLDEIKVKKLLDHYLKGQGGLIYPEFCLPTGRKIDFISFRWKTDYEIEICGYECKGTPSAKTAARTLKGQVAEYQKAVPKMYLVANSREKENIPILCCLNGVGFLNVTLDEVSEKVKPSSERQTVLDDKYFKPLRTTAAMFLSFMECYKDKLKGKKPRKGIYWVSTPEPNDKVQYNCGYKEDSGTVYSSVNIENSRRVLRKIDLEWLKKALTCLSDEYWIRGGLTNRPAPFTPLYTSLIQMNVSSLTLMDLMFLRKRADQALENYRKGNKETVWLNVGKDLWSCEEVLPRRAHFNRVKQAREELSDVYQILSGSKS